MKTLNKLYINAFPLEWVNLEYWPDSSSKRKEIYLLKEDNLVEGLIFLFYSLFGSIKQEITIYNKSWWDLCFDTWNPDKDEYDYQIETKSNETKAYLKMLKEPDIEIGYSGLCRCEEWDKFLAITLKCIITHRAPYSPSFCDIKNDFFFYFHYSGSIGLYYRNDNNIIKNLFAIACKEYDVREIV